MNIADFLSNPEHRKIDNIVRFNSHPFVIGETVSQHSWWVVAFGRMICEYLFTKNSVDHLNITLRIMDRCTFHDFLEGKTGDVLYDLKHNSFNGEELKKLISAFENKLLEEMTGISSTSVNPSLLAHLLYDSMVSCENQSDYTELEESILKMADWLACIKYELNELTLGNKNFVELYSVSIVGLDKTIGRVLNAYSQTLFYEPYRIAKFREQCGMILQYLKQAKI